MPSAFGKVNPFGARINAIFSSDVGHFDVPHMRIMVLPEALELVADRLITAVDLRDFTFANAVRLWGTQNPDFFNGTAVARRPPRSWVTPRSATPLRSSGPQKTLQPWPSLIAEKVRGDDPNQPAPAHQLPARDAKSGSGWKNDLSDP